MSEQPFSDRAMSEYRDAFARAEAQVAAVRDDPPARLALLVRTYHGPTGRAPRHLPFRRAALSFMGWQVHRGLLNPLEGLLPGSVWWRSMNERLLRDGCEAIALVGGLAGGPRRRRCGCGWSSSRPRPGLIGTGLTTPASWAASWTTKVLPTQRTHPSASS